MEKKFEDAFSKVAEVLERRGIDENQIAAFIANLAGGSVPPVELKDNVPGYRYVSRVFEASYNALTNQAEKANGAWAEIKQGRWGFGSAMRMWAEAMEEYYSVAVEVARGPAYAHRPAWLVFPFSKKAAPTLIDQAELDCSVDEGELDYTSFEAFGRGKASKKKIYRRAPLARHSTVSVQLDKDEVKDLDNGDYVSFIFPKGAGSQPPLVIVVLRVSD
jgi:hypothetical protein